MTFLDRVPERWTNVALSTTYLALAGISIRNAVAYGQRIAVMYFAIHLAVAVLFLIRTRTIVRSPHPAGYVAATLALVYVYLFDYTVAVGGALGRAGNAATWAGVLACLASVISLGDCFGILPSYRGVRTRWMYRLVRHPIYASYLVMDLGMLTAFPSPRNAVLVAGGLALAVVRIHYEEKVLRHDRAYVAYSERVRFRIVPGLY